MNKSIPTIKDLYPDLTDEQLKEAEENFEKYLEIALQIYNDLQQKRDFDIKK